MTYKWTEGAKKFYFALFTVLPTRQEIWFRVKSFHVYATSCKWWRFVCKTCVKQCHLKNNKVIVAFLLFLLCTRERKLFPKTQTWLATTFLDLPRKVLAHSLFLCLISYIRPHFVAVHDVWRLVWLFALLFYFCLSLRTFVRNSLKTSLDSETHGNVLFTKGRDEHFCESLFDVRIVESCSLVIDAVFATGWPWFEEIIFSVLISSSSLIAIQSTYESERVFS